MAACFRIGFSFEAAVDEDNVADRQCHAEEPPNKSDSQGVGTGYRPVESDVEA